MYLFTKGAAKLLTSQFKYVHILLAIYIDSGVHALHISSF